ncbi:MAG: hypothetical protein OSJ33_06405 [Muribaculaceae bacterium]|nr:hypothetical protein [Muribaculaceae bacterium]
MNKFLSMVACAAIICGMTSCGDSEVLSVSSAKKALKKEAFFAKDYATHNFNTGFYEVDETDLDRLAKLQTAGMVTFTTQNVVEKQQKSRYEYYRGYVYYTIDIEHTFASVKLTEAGAKLIVAEPTTMRKDIADDMKDNKDYTATMPDYMNAVYTATSSPSSPATETEEEETFQSDDSLQTTKDPNDPNAAYNTILARVNITSQAMLLGHFELVKVKEVFCPAEYVKEGKGTCKYIYKFVDKTPFGYVFDAPSEGWLSQSSATLRHYQDLGWVVTD